MKNNSAIILLLIGCLLSLVLSAVSLLYANGDLALASLALAGGFLASAGIEQSINK